MKIVLIEDTDEQAAPLLDALSKRLGDRGTVLRFVPPSGDESKTYDERLIDDLQSEEYRDADLIVADRDLSKTPRYRGLSESTVRRAAYAVAIPECSYARNAEDAFLRAAEQKEACIAVSITTSVDHCAEQVVAIAEGFSQIVAGVRKHVVSSARRSPGSILAALLGKPEYADKIGLYASGDQSRLESVLRLRKAESAQRERQLSCLLGYWLWDSVLRYPGVIVNEVAAASYLNIHESEFSRREVQAVFESARYTGPFCAALPNLWWRGMLDDVIAEGGFGDGRELAVSRTGDSVKASVCSEDNTSEAGFYCMLSNKPVCMKCSRSGLAWFPRGADLARVSNSQYEELGPWL